MAWRVDNIPLIIRPFWYLWALGTAAFFYGMQFLFRSSCRLSFAGPEGPFPRIEVIWHQTLPLYMLVHLRYRQPFVWMNHPLWFMKPIHLYLGWMGVRQLVLGSSGHGGKQAAQQLVPLLQAGASTLMAVDGPRGPVHTFKDGALDLAIASGLPVVGLRYSSSREWVLKSSWDHKRLLMPFAHLVQECSQPYTVTQANKAEVKAKLSAWLSGAEVV